MKKILCLSLCLTLLLNNNVVFATNYTLQDDTLITDVSDNVSYDKSEWIDSNGDVNYPITVENEDVWMQMDSYDEMVAACNMPSSLLETTSTEELIEIMLKYPLLGDLLLYDDPETALLNMAQQSNILQELINRPDGASKLLDAYCKLEIAEKSELPQNIKSGVEADYNTLNSIVRSGECEEEISSDYENITTNVFIETLLVQDDVVNDLDKEELDVLANEAAEKANEKEQSDVYSAYEYTMYETAEKNGNIDKLGNVETSDSESNDELYGSDTIAYVKTPNGSKVTVFIRKYNASEVASAYAYTIGHYPKAIINSSATTNYNCHSYAWFSQSTSNIYWMNNPGIYMGDGSYKKVGTSPTAVKQKVCYTQYPLVNPCVHSGIVYSISGSTVKLRSKWGAGPLVIHTVSYSPYSGTPIYYK
jgi:hypothetical protein